MAVTVTATVGSAQTPPVVKVVVEGLTVGNAVVVVGESVGQQWVVRGGDLITDSTQVIRFDNLTPINVPVTYRVLVNGSSVATSAPIVVPFGDGPILLASLDGELVVVPTVWQDNALPQKVAIDQHFTRVPGRRNPVMRYALAGSTSGEWSLRLDADRNQTMNLLLADGGPLVLRSDGLQRDLPAIGFVAITDGASSLWGERGTSTDRVWSLSWVEVDNPIGDIALPSDTFQDVDNAYSGSTFADLDAAYPGSTFADFNRFDWAQL
jgi:hypothetical protein